MQILRKITGKKLYSDITWILTLECPRGGGRGGGGEWGSGQIDPPPKFFRPKI